MNETPALKPAVFIGELDGYRGEAYHFRLSEPVVGRVRTTTQEGWMDVQTSDVIVSAIIAHNEVETMIFPADERGKPLSFLDIVAIRAYDHQAALAALGFVITNEGVSHEEHRAEEASA